MKTETTQEYGNRQHAHMLDCAYAWFSQNYSQQWDEIRTHTAEVAIKEMRAIMHTED